MKDKLILLIEDNRKVQNFNSRMLVRSGFAVATATTLASADDLLQKQTPHAIILDIGMPDGSGLDFLQKLRQTSKIPVLLLTGYNETKDIVRGFQSGCDDYLTKPYTYEELLARLLRLLKNAEQVPEIITRGSLTLKLISREAFVGENDLLLTPRDFALLLFFIQNENRVMQAEYIYAQVWGHPMLADSRALENAVSRLRRKIRGSGYTLTSAYGSGYAFERGEAD